MKRDAAIKAKTLLFDTQCQSRPMPLSNATNQSVTSNYHCLQEKRNVSEMDNFVLIIQLGPNSDHDGIRVSSKAPLPYPKTQIRPPQTFQLCSALLIGTCGSEINKSAQGKD